MGHILFTKTGLKRTLGICFCVLFIIVLRLLLDQWQAYDMGMDMLEKGDNKNAIMFFDRTINAHIPFSPLENNARSELLKLASGYEKNKDYEFALLCYESVRTSRYLARHIWVPDNDELPFLNDRIADIKATLLVRDGMFKDHRKAFDQQMTILSSDYAPSTFWSIIVVITFWAYLGLIVLWIFRRKKVYLTFGILSFMLWIVALYLA